MATFGEIVYMVLDLLKERSDDAYYTEEHILFLASKIRALLLERKYHFTRNSTFKPVSEENRQQICFDVEPTDSVMSGCSGGWLKTTQALPQLLGENSLNVYPVAHLVSSVVTFIPFERMPYVGHNKWLKDIIYCARGADGFLYLHSVNPNFLYLEKIKADGIFTDPEKAASISCDTGDGSCDIMSKDFPLETALVPQCIELVLQELTGSRYAPEDKQNNAKDDLSDIGIAPRRNTKPVENSQYKKNEEAEE